MLVIVDHRDLLADQLRQAGDERVDRPVTAAFELLRTAVDLDFGRQLDLIARVLDQVMRDIGIRLLRVEILLREDAADILGRHRSEEHTSELQSLMRISYAVFCLKKKKK